MRLLTGPVLAAVFASATVHAYAQPTPDFSGRWTEREVARGQTATSMTVSQDSNSITVQSGPGLRYTLKLDGSPSKNVTWQNDREMEQVSTAVWDGNRLVISTPGRSNREGPWTIRQVWALEGTTLVVTSTRISDTTKATLSELKQTFSR